MSARQVASESSEDEYFSVGAQAYGGADTSDSDADSLETTSMAPPRHPVPAMQGAFEESIQESSDPNPQSRPSKDETAETRRQKVLEVRQYDDSWTARWRQRPTARHHPLAKLMAQIVFGMHLLQQQAAKSDEEVVKILQTHVDEVDSFLEKTTEDFDLAIKDISERINFLKLPMDHPDVFGTMLEDKAFRTQLMEGNEKIETIIERTSRAMNAALHDIQRGKTATKELGHYLNAVSDDWPGEKADLEAVLNAMRGNEQGWKHCLKDLQGKAHELRDSMDQLSTVIREMARMAAEASRRTRAHGRALSSAQQPMSAIPRSKFSSDAAVQRSRAMSIDKPDTSSQRSRAMSVDKPLPKAPINTNGPVELEAHPVPMERRYEEPRPTPVSPERIERERSRRSSTVPPRPLTAGMKPRESRNMNRNDTRDIVEFLQEGRQPSPLQNHPSNERDGRSSRNNKRQSAIDVMEHVRSISRSSVRRSRDERPQTADGNTALSGSEPTRTEPYRKGIERNKHGPPPAGGRESSRRSSSIGPFMRRLSFRSNSRPQSPARAGASPPPESRPVTSRRYSAASMRRERETASPTNHNPDTAPEVLTQRTVSPNLTQRTISPNLAPPTNRPSESPSTPSATSGRSTTDSPTLTITTPGTENLSPAMKSDSGGAERGAGAPARPKLVSTNSTSSANPNANGSVRSVRSSLSKGGAAPAGADDKKRGRGMSFRRFFGSSNKAPKERVPRAAMTYGDLA